MYLLVLYENLKTSLCSRTTVFPGFAGTFSFWARLTPLNLASLVEMHFPPSSSPIPNIVCFFHSSVISSINPSHFIGCRIYTSFSRWYSPKWKWGLWSDFLIKSGKDGAKRHRLYAKCLILIDILIKMIRYSYL